MRVFSIFLKRTSALDERGKCAGIQVRSERIADGKSQSGQVKTRGLRRTIATWANPALRAVFGPTDWLVSQIAATCRLRARLSARCPDVCRRGLVPTGGRISAGNNAPFRIGRWHKAVVFCCSVDYPGIGRRSIWAILKGSGGILRPLRGASAADDLDNR